MARKPRDPGDAALLQHERQSRRADLGGGAAGAWGFSLNQKYGVSPSNIFVGIQPIFDQVTYSSVFAHIRLSAETLQDALVSLFGTTSVHSSF